MGTPMIVLGLLLYIAAGLTLWTSPTSVQEITALLIATNATLFLVGGVVIAALASRDRD